MKFVKFLKTLILESICEQLLLLVILFFQLTSLLNNISYLGVKIKKAKAWKADTLKICRYSEFNIKLIILQQLDLKSFCNTIKPLVATFSKTTGLSSRKNVSEQGMSLPQ